MRTTRLVVIALFVGCNGGSAVTDAGVDAGTSDAAKDSGNDAPTVQDAASSDAADAADAPDAVGPYSALDDISKWSTFDLRSVATDAREFEGAAFDGKYVYFVPFSDGSTFHGLVGRYDTTATFTNASSWATFDTTNVGMKGLAGAAFEGHSVYFAPANGGHVARYDTLATFGSSASWSTFDTTTLNSGASGFAGAVFDGQYVYIVPVYGNTVVTRYDPTANFTASSSWSAFDIKTVNSGAFGSIGGVFDGRYVYFVPYFNGGAPLWRYDTQAAFGSTASWSSFDITTVSAGVPGYRSAVFDGKYIYLVPGNDGTVLRYDTTATFTAPGSWSTFNLGSLGAQQFFGGAFDGRYIYFVGGVVGRYDTLASFTSSSSWATFDMSVVSAGADGGGTAGSGGLAGAAFDGRYLYFAPATSGLVVRFDARTPSALPTGPAHGSFF